MVHDDCAQLLRLGVAGSVDVIGGQLLRRHAAGCASEQVFAEKRLWERQHLPQALSTTQHCHQPIKACMQHMLYAQCMRHRGE